MLPGVIDGVQMYHDRPWLTVAADGTPDGTIDLSVAEGPAADGEPGTVLVRSTDAGASWSPSVAAVPDYYGGYGYSAFGVVDEGEPVLTYLWYDDLDHPSQARYGTMTLEQGASEFVTREFGSNVDATKAFPTYVSDAGGHACFTFLGPKAQRRAV